MRRSVQPTCPRAMTCCRFVSLKILTMSVQGPHALAPRQRPERLLPMAGFQVSTYGRFWVSTEVAGITCQPNEAWMKETARKLTDAQDGFLRGVRYLILDRDPLYTTAVRCILRDSGVNPLPLPARSPNLNAYAERFVLSAKSECLERIVPLGEKHLRAAVREFVGHYHEERPHQGLGNQLIAPQAKANRTGPLKCRERLGGVLKFYYCEAA